MVTGTYTPDRYNTNGAQTEFDITFEFTSEDHIHVWIRNKTTGISSELSNPTDFSVSGAEIITVDTWPAGYELIIKRVLVLKQNTDYIRNDPLPSDKVEWDFDKVVEMVQQHEEMFSRAALLGPASKYSDVGLPEPEDKYNLIWNAGKLINALRFGASDFAIQLFMATFLESLTQEAAVIALGADSDWHEIGAAGEPAFENSWANVGGVYANMAFRIDADKFMHWRGRVDGGADGTSVFTLPVDKRPDEQLEIPVRAEAAAYISIHTNGEVYLHAA